MVTDVARYFAKFKTPPSTLTKTVKLEPWAHWGELWASGATACMDFRLVQRLAWLSSLCQICLPPFPTSFYPWSSEQLLHGRGAVEEAAWEEEKTKNKTKHKTQPYCSRRKVLVKKLSFGVWREADCNAVNLFPLLAFLLCGFCEWCEMMGNVPGPIHV